jgi:hypothetical protein
LRPVLGEGKVGHVRELARVMRHQGLPRLVVSNTVAFRSVLSGKRGITNPVSFSPIVSNPLMFIHDQRRQTQRLQPSAHIQP